MGTIMRKTNYRTWSIAVVGGLVLTLGFGDFLNSMLGSQPNSANAFQRGGRGGGGGGGGGNPGRGGGGGGRPSSGGGGGAAHPGGGSRAPSVNRTPSFSRPNFTPRSTNPGNNAGPRNPDRNPATAGPRGTPGRAPNANPQAGAGTRTGTSANPNGVRNNAGVRVGGPNAGANVRNNTNLNNNRPHQGSVNANLNNRINDRDFNRNRNNVNNVNRNFINLGNRRLGLGPVGYRPAYNRHRFYHGYWNGNYGRYGFRPYGGYGYYGGYGGFGRYGYGRYGFGSGFGYGLGLGYGLGGLGYGLGFGYRPLGWGYGSWGLGSLAYNSGYLGYSNPYYGGGFSGYNYAQPIPVSYAAVPVDDGSGTAADSPQAQLLDNAVAAFRQNDYNAALDIINKGVAQYPDDSVLHEFRGLVLFAKQDYQQAAATIHSVLAVGPGWDWTTLSGLYTDVAIYTQQLRALEAFTRQNPNDGGSRFLLAYHYMTDGHPEAAARQFEYVTKLVPNDRVAADVLKMLTAPTEEQVAAAATATPAQPGQEPRPALAEAPDDPASTARTTPAPTEDAGPPPRPLDEAALVGTWTATRDDGSKFVLTIAADKKFQWKFTPPKGEKPTEFGGTYTIDGNVLALESKEGGSLIAGVVQEAGKFNFKLIGAPKEDPGLNFSKNS